MKYFWWTLKLLIVLIFSISYLCMIAVLYCGCWACNVAVGIGIVGLLLGLYDRYQEFRRIKNEHLDK